MSTGLPIYTLATLIEDLLTFTVDPNLHGDEDLRASPPEFPIHFYDRHLDSKLTLERVKVVPSLVKLLSDFCDTELERFKSQVKAVQRYEAIPEQPTEMRCARDFAGLYGECFAKYCLRFPSALYLHPTSAKWESVTTYASQQPSRNRLSTFVAEARISVHGKYQTPYTSERHARGLYLPDEASVRALYEIHDHSPCLALWHLYPVNMSGEKVITQMANASAFKWETSNSINPHPNSAHLHQNEPDSNTSVITLTHTAANAGRRQTPTGRSRISRRGPSVAIPSVPRRDFNSTKPYRTDWRHFIQHAWAQAVAQDVTFIVLTCGRLERIGIRHRASRTLYLSDVIKPVTVTSPTYGKIHFGLHFAILQDALARHDVRKRLSSGHPTKLPKPLSINNKRVSDASDDEDQPPTKRHKTGRRQKTTTDIDTISRALSERNLFFLNLNYGTFQSPAPSSFMRKAPSCAPGFYKSYSDYTLPERRKSYGDKEYVTLSLGKPIGNGATGTTHRASAEIRLESGKILRHPLAVKLVFLDRMKRRRDEPIYSERLEEQRLWDEYLIYQHLAAAGCWNGILPVFGLFEDIETGALALVMADGGTSLESLWWKVEPNKYIKFALQEAEQQQLLDAMQKIHEAGVRHRDIWATNILKGDKNEFSIIDFDMAEIVPYPSESMTREKLKLEQLVKGIDTGEDVELLYSF